MSTLKIKSHRYWLLLICLMFSGAAKADHLQYSVLEDASKQISFAQARTMEFAPVDVEVLSFGFSPSAYWVKFDSSDIKDAHELLYSCQTQLDYLDLYIPSNTGWREISVGTSRPFSNRDIAHPCFVFDVTGVEDSQVYLRVESDGILKLALSLSSKAEFWEHQLTLQFFYGLYFALMSLILLINFIFYGFTRERVHLYCAGYLGGIALFLATMSGHASMYFWPNAVLWADIAPVALVAFSMACGLLCVRGLVASECYSPQLARLAPRVAPFALVIPLVNLFSAVLAIILLGLFMILALLIASVMIVISTYERYPPAYILMVAFAVLLPSSLLYFWNALGFVEKQDWINVILYLTSSLEGILLTVALVYRQWLLRSLTTQPSAQPV